MYIFEPLQGKPMLSEDLDTLLVAIEAQQGKEVNIGVAVDEDSPPVVFTGRDTEIGLMYHGIEVLT